MPQQMKIFRVFVSSTFSDMRAERNVLQEKVFPELQQLCEANSCRFQAVDLRWGVSEEATLDQQTMNICLTELKRCQDVSPRPNFIILLGDRYGWIPLPPQVQASEFEEILSQTADDDNTLLNEWYKLDSNAVPPEYVFRPRREDISAETDYEAWGKTEERLRAIFLGAVNSLGWPLNDERRIKYECSATHQEIIEGALKLPDEREHVFAFLRSIKNVNDLPAGSDYADAGLEKAQALKKTIKETKGITSYSYDVTWSGQDIDSHIEQFAIDALAALRRIIEEEFLQLQQIDDLTRENIAHEEFGAERCRHFVGRQKILDDIAAHISDGQHAPLVVYGLSGSGKSALMAKAAVDAAHNDVLSIVAPRHIIQRFIGATPESTDIRTLLRNLCVEIYQQFEFDRFKEEELADVTDPETRAALIRRFEIPEEYQHLSEKFRTFLDMIPGDRRLLIFLDGLDQLNTSDNAHSLSWLPSWVAPNVKIIVSVLEREDEAGQCLRSARARLDKSMLLRLEDMTSAEGEQVLHTWLLEAYPEKKRTLTEEQMKSVLAGFRGCPQPLYLKLAFEEARRWKSYEGLPQGMGNVPGLAGDVPGVVGQMLTRLQDKKQHGEVLVNAFLGLLSAARHGLSETELLELLSVDEVVMADLRARSKKSPETKGIPAVVWLRLYHDFAPYMIERSADKTVLFNFYHRQVGETVKRDYLNPEWHTRLAHYFHKKSDPAGDSTWSGNYVHGLSELPFQQTASESMWDELEATLTDLNFIAAKCKTGMVYDLVADYNNAEWAWPGQEEERKNEEARLLEIRAYVDKLISHAKNPQANPLPDPPPLMKIRSDESSTDMRHDWTPLECVRAWGHFTRTHIRQLANGEEPVFQMAWNSAASGPVAEQVAEMEHRGKGIAGEWFRLRNRPLFTPHPACLRVLEGYSSVAITPDGRRAVSGSADNALRLWDLATGECLKVLKGLTGEVSAISITPDGRLAVSAGNLHLWDLATGACLRVLEGHSPVAITPDGRRAVSGSSDNTLRLWDLATGECLKVLKGHTYEVWDVSITPDGERAISGSRDNDLRLWDLATGTCLKVLEGHTGEVQAVSITPDGARAVSGGLDCTLRVWDLATGECLNVLKGHTYEVWDVSITPDGARAVSGGLDCTLRVWDLATGECLKVLEGHTQLITAVSITFDGGRAISRSSDNTLRLWDLATNECLNVLERHMDRVSAVSITFDGERAVSGSADNALRLWDLATGACLKVLKGHTCEVRAVSITPDGGRAVSGSSDKTLRLWDLATGACLKVLKGHTDDIWNVSITHDGGRAVSGSRDNTLRLWDLATGECRHVLEVYKGGIWAVSITPDGRQATSGSPVRTLNVWDLATGACRNTLVGYTGNAIDDPRMVGHSDFAWAVSITPDAVSITPDGRRALSGSEENTLRLWDLATGGCLKVMKGHTDRVSAVSITPDGRRALSGSKDHTLRLWDLATGECLKVMAGHTGEVFAILITPDGGRVLSGSKDHTLRLWDLTTGECRAVCGIEFRVESIAMHGASLVVGEENGRMDMITIENYCPGRAVITPTRLWLFASYRWDANLSVLCPQCGGRFDADAIADITRSIGFASPDSIYLKLPSKAWDDQRLLSDCPHCHKPLRFNPFIVNNREEHKVENRQEKSRPSISCLHCGGPAYKDKDNGSLLFILLMLVAAILLPLHSLWWLFLAIPMGFFAIFIIIMFVLFNDYTCSICGKVTQTKRWNGEIRF